MNCRNGHIDPPRNTQNNCRLCAAAKARRWRANNKEYVLSRNRAAKLKMIEMKGGKCTDCLFDDIARPEAFQFDHINDDKEFVLSQARGLSNKVLLELEKCELVCANCHATRTVKRQNGVYAK